MAKAREQAATPAKAKTAEKKPDPRADFFVSTDKAVEVTLGGKTYKFFAKQIGWLVAHNIGIQAYANGENGLARLVAESIEDEKGRKFTYDEVLRLRKEIAEPLYNAVIEAHKAPEADGKN